MEAYVLKRSASFFRRIDLLEDEPTIYTSYHLCDAKFFPTENLANVYALVRGLEGFEVKKVGIIDA